MQIGDEAAKVAHQLTRILIKEFGRYTGKVGLQNFAEWVIDHTARIFLAVPRQYHGGVALGSESMGELHA